MTKKRCPAILELSDNLGDNPCTFRCRKKLGHKGPHEEISNRNRVKVQFTKNDLTCESCRYHESEDPFSYLPENFYELGNGPTPAGSEERKKLWIIAVKRSVHTCKLNNRKFRRKTRFVDSIPTWCPAMKEGI